MFVINELQLNHQNILITENIQKKIDLLLNELKEITGVSDEDIDEFRKILDLTDFSEDKN